eukprot:6211496-Pleurochrysis_carterae.AAC.2
MGLEGTLGGDELDRWEGKGPSAVAATNIKRLRKAARAHVMEATSAGARREHSRCADFFASTHAVCRSGRARRRAVQHQTLLVLFKEFIRQCGLRQ